MHIPSDIPGEVGTTGEDRTLRTVGADISAPGFQGFRRRVTRFQPQICPLLASGLLNQRNRFFGLKFFVREINKVFTSRGGCTN